MFITASDFDYLPYVIPNLDKTPNVMPAFVDEYETNILVSLLGVDLYNAFVEGLAALPGEWAEQTAYAIGDEVVYGVSVWTALTANSGVIPIEGFDWTVTDLNNRWLKLKKGAPYMLNSKTYNWPGMVKMLRPYIFSEYVRATFDSNSGIGVVIANAENSSIISPSSRIASAWNTFARIAGTHWMQRDTLYGFLNQEGALHVFDDTFGDEFVDFYGYLNFVFKAPGTQNIFDL